MIRGGTLGGNSYNVSNDLRTIQQEKHNSISCVYDILDLNNSGKWNEDGTIELYRPGSSSQLDMIKFRSFSANIRSDISTLTTPTVIGYLCCNFEFNENDTAADPRTSSTDYCEGQEFIRDSISYSDMTLNIANQAGNHQYQSANAIYDNDIQHEIILSEFQIPLVDSFDESITDLLQQARYSFGKIFGVFDTNDSNNQTLTNQSSFTWYEKIASDSYVKDGNYTTGSTTYDVTMSNVTYLNIPGESVMTFPFSSGSDNKRGQIYYVRATNESENRNFMLLYSLDGSEPESINYTAVPNYFIYSFALIANISSSGTYLNIGANHNAFGNVSSGSLISLYHVPAEKLFWDSSSETAWPVTEPYSLENDLSILDVGNIRAIMLNSSYIYNINEIAQGFSFTRLVGDSSAMTSSIDLIQKKLRLQPNVSDNLYVFAYRQVVNGTPTTRKYTWNLSNTIDALSTLVTLKSRTDYVYFLGHYMPTFTSESPYFFMFAVFLGVIFYSTGSPTTYILIYRIFSETDSFGNTGNANVQITTSMISQEYYVTVNGALDFAMLDYINTNAETTRTPYRFDDFDYEMALNMWELQNIHVPNSFGTFILPSINGSRSVVVHMRPGTTASLWDNVSITTSIFDMKYTHTKTWDYAYVQMNKSLMFVQCWDSDGNNHIITTFGSMCTLLGDGVSMVALDSVRSACIQSYNIFDAWLNGSWRYRDITNIVKNLNITTPILNYYINELKWGFGDSWRTASYSTASSRLDTVLNSIDSLWGADGTIYDISDYSDEVQTQQFVMANSNVSLVLESRADGYVWNNSYVQFFPLAPDVTDAAEGENVYIWDDTQHITAKNGDIYHALTEGSSESFYDAIFSVDTSSTTSVDTSSTTSSIACPYLNMVSSDYKYSGKLHFYVKFHTNPSVVNFDPNIIQHSRFSTEDNVFKQFINHTGNLGVETYPISRMYYFTDEDLYNRIVVYLGIQNTDQTLKLVVNGYGSTNDIVFYLNETSMIDYKDYVVDPTMRCITCAIYDASGEILTPSIASSIYSNITICCDWSFYN